MNRVPTGNCSARAAVNSCVWFALLADSRHVRFPGVRPAPSKNKTTIPDKGNGEPFHPPGYVMGPRITLTGFQVFLSFRAVSQYGLNYSVSSFSVPKRRYPTDWAILGEHLLNIVPKPLRA